VELNSTHQWKRKSRSCNFCVPATEANSLEVIEVAGTTVVLRQKFKNALKIAHAEGSSMRVFPRTETLLSFTQNLVLRDPFGEREFVLIVRGKSEHQSTLKCFLPVLASRGVAGSIPPPLQIFPREKKEVLGVDKSVYLACTSYAKEN